MPLPETLGLAFRGLRRRPVRSALTALGVVIGVASVVAMVTIGRGTSEKVSAEIRKLGTELLTLRVGQEVRGGSGARLAAEAFDYADVEAVRQEIPGLRSVAPVATAPHLAVGRRASWTATVIGSENEVFEARRWRLASGRIFTGHEVHSGRSVCVIGATVRRELFPEIEPIGELIRIKSVGCEVIGVLAPRGQSGVGADDDSVIVMPLNGYLRRIQGNPDITAVLALAHTGVDTRQTRQRIEALMRERRRIGAGSPDNFSVLDMRQVADAMAETTRTLTLLLAAIAAVSLLVGGIGVMNIMLVAVSERTREIGIRMAIGALPHQIMAQFLTEAVILAGLGGGVGIAVGLLLAAIARAWIDIPFILDPVTIVVAFTASALVGVLFGFVPARRAAHLDPAEALRQG